MSLATATSAQNITHFRWTQEIWNQAWHSDDGFSMKSLCAKVACIVFPIILSVALVEGILWTGRSIFKISSDPKTDPLDPSSVKKALQESSNKKTEQEEGVKKGNEQQEEGVKKGNEQQEALNPIDDSVKTPSLVPVNSDEQLGINSTIKVTNVDDNAVKNPNIIKLDLNTGSSQHDIVVNRNDREGRKPPACAFHALQAIEKISSMRFAWENRFKDRDIERLSELQRDMIQFGTGDYFDALEMDPSFKEDASLENIKKKYPKHLSRNRLFFEQTNQDKRPVAERTQAIVEHLFIEQEEPADLFAPRKIVQMAFLKNGNGQSIGVVCVVNKVIVFNAHKNEITMTVGKEATQEYLTEILKDGMENPFSYALGQYNFNKKAEKEDGLDNNKQQQKPNPIIDIVKVAVVDDNAAKNQNIITLDLNTGSSQHDIVFNAYDLENQRPPVCAFHVLRAIDCMSSGFYLWENPFEDRHIKVLSELQQDMIRVGMRDYFKTLEKDTSFKEGVDLEKIKIKLPKYLTQKHLVFEQTNEDPSPVAERTLAIVDHLFIEQEKLAAFAPRKIAQIAFLKNGKGESIGVVCAENKAIVFNPHYNAITMTIGKEATQTYLTEIMKVGMDLHPFSYALGQYRL